MRPEILRAEIRESVTVITPLDQVEAGDRDAALAWVDSGAPLFREPGPSPARHLAVYFAVVDIARRTVLQLEDREAGVWVFPGGHVDTVVPAVTVVRAADEELGIQFTLHPEFGDRPLMVTRAAGEHVVLWFVLSGSETSEPPGDDREYAARRWVSIDDAPAWVRTCDAPDRMSSFVRKLVQRLGGQQSAV